MSRSPKYTTARLAREREQELARQRAARQAARRAAAEAAERAWVAAQVQRQIRQLDGLQHRLDGLTVPGSDPALQQSVRKARGDIGALRDQAGQAATRAAVNALSPGIAAVQRDVHRCAADIADALAREERRAALDGIRAVLDAAPQRASLDPGGAARVDQLMSAARAAAGSPGAFPAAYSALSAAVQAHVNVVTEHEAQLQEAQRSGAAALSAIGRVLEEARAAGAELPGLAEAGLAAARLRLDMEANLVEETREGATILQRAADSLGGALESWFDRLDRTQQVVEAATAALPRAGFRLVRGSLARTGTSVTFRAERADGSPLSIMVKPGEEGAIELSYHGSGPDYAIQQNMDGSITARCGTTEQLLERLHEELDRESVTTNGLHWEGKPPLRETQTVQYWEATGEAQRSRPS